MLNVLTIKLATCYVSSKRTSKRENIKYKNSFVENCFVIYCSEYASGVRNLYSQGDFMF